MKTQEEMYHQILSNIIEEYEIDRFVTDLDFVKSIFYCETVRGILLSFDKAGIIHSAYNELMLDLELYSSEEDKASLADSLTYDFNRQIKCSMFVKDIIAQVYSKSLVDEDSCVAMQFLNNILYHAQRLSVQFDIIEKISDIACYVKISRNLPTVKIDNSFRDKQNFQQMTFLKAIGDKSSLNLKEFIDLVFDHPIIKFMSQYHEVLEKLYNEIVSETSFCSGKFFKYIEFEAYIHNYTRQSEDTPLIVALAKLFNHSNMANEIDRELLLSIRQYFKMLLDIANEKPVVNMIEVDTNTPPPLPSVDENGVINFKDETIGFSNIATLTTNLTQKAQEGELKFGAISRESELESIIQTLSRKQKNHPVLVGHAGVGKTAVVEELAIRIAKNEVPNNLKNSLILSLSVGDLKSGTQYRGQLEQRVKDLVYELERLSDKSKGKVFLYIDEIHQIMENIDSNASLNIAGQLKGPLSRNKFSLIGSTTYSEYHKFIESDKAVERRFKFVDIKEPDLKTTLVILKRVKEDMTKYHKVEIKDEILTEIIDLGARYIPSRNNPDISIDILDELCAKLKLDKSGQSQENALYEVVSKMSNVPNIKKDNQFKIKDTKESLEEKIIGQEEAIRAVCEAVAFSNSPFGENTNRPMSFLFQGPTGVGKTELARTLSQKLQMPLLRYDMSEYQSEMGLTKLIGSSAGFEGGKNGGKFTNDVKSNPYSIILLDELEKADDTIKNLFLQVLDYGKITDGKGESIDCSNTIIIMTTNAGYSVKSGQIGFTKEKVAKNKNAGVSGSFTPEFLNRIDSIVAFNEMTPDVIEKIAKQKLEEVKRRLNENGIELNYDRSIVEEVAKKGYDPTMGVRPLERVVKKEILFPISNYLNENCTKVICIRLEENRFVISESASIKEEVGVSEVAAV